MNDAKIIAEQQTMYSTLSTNFKRGDVILVHMYVNGTDNQIGSDDTSKVWASYNPNPTDFNKEGIWGLVSVPFTAIKEHHPRAIHVGDYVKYKNSSDAIKMKVIGMYEDYLWVIIDGEPYTTYARSVERVLR